MTDFNAKNSIALVNCTLLKMQSRRYFINKARTTIKNLCLAITELFDVQTSVHVIGWRHSEKLLRLLLLLKISNSVDHGQYLRISMDSRVKLSTLLINEENIIFKDYTSPM